MSLVDSRNRTFNPLRRHMLASLVAAPVVLLPRAWAQGTVYPPPITPLLSYAQRPEVQAFVEEFVQKRGGTAGEVLDILNQAQYSATAERLMTPAGKGAKRSWRAYRSRFVEPVRIRAGLQFWQENEAVLAKAYDITGVEPSVIVGIIGVETIFGRNMGNFRVLDALMTLSFDYLRRADYFKTELEQFLLLRQETALDHNSTLGSFAGAMGLPQFMPSSIRKHAVDMDGDGTIDLRNNPHDAIGSVARYLADYGWIKGEAISVPARVNRDVDLAPLLSAGPEPRYTPAQLAALGISPQVAAPEEAKALLVDLPTADETPEYRMGLTNFYVITRYNRSYFYAAAVQDLAEAVAAARTVARTPA
jgi:membrane-bound lytic murein transglycosylase B